MDKHTRLKTVLYQCASLVVLLCLGVMSMFYLAVHDQFDKKSRLAEIAKSRAGVISIDHIDCYHGTQSYLSLFGKNKAGNTIIVTIEEQSEQLLLSRPSNGISAKEAQEIAYQAGARTIEAVTFGIENHKRIWEVAAQNGYYLIDFKTAKVIKKEVL